jgi:hypothetical protein
MSLQHQFWTANTPAQGFWAEKVFKGVYSLQQLENNLQKIAFPKDPEELNGHDPLTLMGDGFEGFGEIFFNVFGLHPDIKVTNLKVCPPGQIGFDFKYSHTRDYSNGTIQSKYIGKGKAFETELRESETMKLERFQNASLNIGGVSADATDNLIVFTNATGIDYFTADTLLYGKVRCISRKHIDYLTKDNLAVWDTARSMIMQTNHYIKF